MSVQGIDTFRDFAESVDDIDVDAAIKRAVDQTADDYISELTGILKRETTSKGGTFHSDTSPYDPGGSNSSSTDSLHISEPSAWQTYKQGRRTAVIRPKEEVADRARMMQTGTKSHGPDGDTPMYFRLNGMIIVVTDSITFDSRSAFLENRDGDLSLDARFEHGEPGEVDGVDGVNYFTRAYFELLENRRLVNNIENELEREVREAGLA